MTDKELWDRIMKDTEFEKNAAQSISEQIEQEMTKKKPDYDKIAELSAQYSELVGTDEEIESSFDEHCRKILAAVQRYSPKRSFLKKIIGLAASLIVILATANCYTVSAYNMNIFKAIVHYANNGFSVDFTNKTVTDDDPYGIKAECAKYGIHPEVPTYLPEGFEILEINHERVGVETTIDFLYHKEDMTIGIYYDIFDNKEDMSSVGYPSDYFNMSEIEINGYPAITSKEDGQYTLVYGKNNILLTIYTVNVPYSECDKIIESIR